MNDSIPVLGADEYLKRFLEAPRPGAECVLAYYEHRIGAIATDPRFLCAPLDDHLVHRGDGVFETLKWEEKRLYQLEPHLARMQRSAKAIRLGLPCSIERVGEIAVAVARAAGTEHGYLRLLLGRGPGGFGIDPGECPVPSLYAVAYKFSPKPQAWFDQGVTAFRTAIRAKQSYMATIKSTNYLPNALMKLEAREKGFDFPLCFDETDLLAEGATENICLVTADGTLVVPEFTNALAGTTILRALELVKDETPVAFRAVRESDVYEARELIIVGTSPDAVAVVRYNGKPIHDARPGPVAARLRELLRKDLRENGVLL